MSRAGSAILAAAIALAACRTRPLDPADVGDVGDGGSSSCPVRTIGPVPLSALHVADLNVWEGAYARAVIHVKRYSCMPPAPTHAVLDAAAHTVTITARGWSSPSPCDDLVEEKQVIDLDALGSLPPGTLTLRDGAPGGTLTYQHPILPPPTASCAPVDQCKLDCQCGGSRPRCWPDSTQCVRTCARDVDCPSPLEPMCEDGLCFGMGQGCRSRACRFGESCRQIDGYNVCRPRQTTRPGIRCTTDGDCGPGAICSGCACVLPCASASECPTGLRCDDTRGCVP